MSFSFSMTKLVVLAFDYLRKSSANQLPSAIDGRQTDYSSASTIASKPRLKRSKT